MQFPTATASSRPVFASGLTIEQRQQYTHLNRDGVLTSREYEVVELIATGYTNKEIVERLFISVKTVETHKFNVVHKLELSSMCELRQWVRQKRVV